MLQNFFQLKYDNLDFLLNTAQVQMHFVAKQALLIKMTKLIYTHDQT